MSRRIEPSALGGQLGLGRLLSELEAGGEGAQEILAALPKPAGPCHRLGITGTPGVGKSTLLDHLIALLRAQGERVGVIAVDPTSPLTGGAILADRLRLSRHSTDDGVFIRSLASRGSLGGVAPAASAVAAVLEAAGYSRVLIETVGMGQTGYDVASLADTVAVLLSPEAGDAVQLLKAGVLEVGDVFAVNKSDRPGAEALIAEIEASLDLSGAVRAGEWHHGLAEPTSARDIQVGGLERAAASQPVAGGRRPPLPPVAGELGPWRPPVIRLIASQGVGVEQFADRVEAHRTWLSGLGADHPRRRQRIVRELAFILRTEVSAALETALAPAIESLATEVHGGACTLWEAAAKLRAELRERL